MKGTTFSDLQNKVCVITGGGGTIGNSLAMGLAKVGMKVAILDISKNNADELAEKLQKELNCNAIGIEANVLEKSSLIAAQKLINEKLGAVDFLINGAGGNSPAATTKTEFITDDVESLDDTFFGLDLKSITKVFDLNFMGTLVPTMVFGKEMIQRKSGTILNISSMNSFRPLTKIPAYSAAKSSINNLTEWLAVHFAKMNVRVNAIAPGFFITAQNKFLLIDENTNELTNRGNKIIAATPMGKFGEPDDLIGATLFLLSNASEFITGVVLPVDGGFNAYSGV
ncbi:MAG: SDR family NAD(P)-dependent oxidoreductase [Melioribacteraceae bacterium]|nr:SDR family NAD(P)-dependent oxidoreductase [Melioribacteraceae bacterium]WKZ69397.1 MAG: SDR family NAD(P)-dependent oxidoreductase [Melioribacteraceae bacterium]